MEIIYGTSENLDFQYLCRLLNDFCFDVRNLILNYKLGAMNKYEIIIFWSEENKIFIAEILELAGCLANGATYQEALANAETIIGEWIETARDSGRQIPDPKGRLICA